MTVASNTPYNQYSATSGQTTFNYTFEIVDDTDLLVYQRADTTDPDDSSQLLTLTTDYTVTGVGNDGGGTIVLTSGATVDDVITIVQNVPVERDSSFTPGGVLRAQDLNTEYDNLTLIDQRRNFDINNRMLKYNYSAEIESEDIVLPKLSANQIWAKNNANSALIPYDVPASGGLAPSDAKYLLQQADSDLPNSQALGSLASGFIFNTTTTGVQGTRVLQGTANEISLINGDGLSGNPTIGIADNPVIPGDQGMVLPGGTTAQRPGSPTEGEFRFNEDLETIELRAGGVWKSFSDGGVVDSVSGTANQIDVDSSDPQNPIASLPSAIDAPGTFTIQSSSTINSINNDPNLASASINTMSTDSALKQYIDEAVADIHYINPVRVASTGNFASTYNNGSSGVGATLTASSNGAASIDGVSLSLNDRVLFKDQSTDYENGIYFVSQVGDGSNPAIYTRAMDFDEPSEIEKGDLVLVREGTDNEGTGWLQTNDVSSIGSDSIVFVHFVADFSNVVTIDGVQTVTGAKTFSSTTTFTDKIDVDNLRLDGNTIQVSTGNLILDNAGGGEVDLRVSGVNVLRALSSSVILETTLNANSNTINNVSTLIVEDEIQHAGDSNNRLIFGTDTQDFQTGGLTRLDLSNSGARVTDLFTVKDPSASGTSANPRIDFDDSTDARLGYIGYGSAATDTFFILNDTASGDISLRTNGTERANLNNSGFKLGVSGARVTTIRDEDDMASNSATSLVTQQSLVAYQKFVHINNSTISSDAQIDITNLDGYESVKIVLNSIDVQTDATELQMLISTDNGSTFVTTTNYSIGYLFSDMSAGSSNNSSAFAGDGYFRIYNNMSSVADENLSGTIEFIKPDDASTYPRIIYSLMVTNAAGTKFTISGAGIYEGDLAVNAIRFQASSGNLDSGSISVWGQR